MNRLLVCAPLMACLLASLSCGAGGRASDPVPSSCRVMLPPRGTGATADAAPSDPAPPFAAARSTLVVNADIPLAGVKQSLESKIARRVAEERDHDIGVAGRLEYTVDRGPFSVAVQGDALIIEAPLHAHAQACAKGRCYAGCDPEARVTARVPLRLGADYKFMPSSVRIDVTRGCELRALGGFLRVNVTPMIQSRLAQETKRIEGSIDRELPDLRPQAQRMWGELSRARPLPLGACVVLAPEGITQGPASGTGEVAQLRFGLLARPELRVRCGDAPPAVPLPKLIDDAALPKEGDLHLAIVLPKEAPANALAAAAEPIDLGPGRALMHQASGPASDLVVELAGEACGSLGARARGATWGEDGRSVKLAGIALHGADMDRLRSVSLDAPSLVKAMEHAPIAVPVAASELKNLLPELARGLSDDRVSVSADVADARPENAGLRGGEVVAVVRLRGAVTLRAK